MHNQESKGIFELDFHFQSRLQQILFSLVKTPLERLFCLNQLHECYKHLAGETDPIRFLQKSLEVLGLSYEIEDYDRVRIPTSGPLIVVSNHPFGGAEGIILTEILRSIRPDVKFFGNFLLQRVPELQDFFFFVDPFAYKDSAKKNIRPLRDAVRWVNDGGLLAVFPSGTVSHLNLFRREITDPEWSDTVARIVKMTGAPVLPVYFHGTNSKLFHLLGLIHPRLRTAMLPRELLNKRGKCLQVSVGNLISPKKLSLFSSNEELLSYLRLRTYILANRSGHEKKKGIIARLRSRRIPERVLDAIAEAEAVEVLEKEIEGLPSEQLLVTSEDFKVYYAQSQQIPHILREIGRLREISFRKAGEGTGKSLDLDSFDEYYTHLVAWNTKQREIVGAYRLGRTDEILPRFGVQGLYTNTLFAYKKGIIEQLGPALEMGRSFVRPEYQKAFTSLLVLWMGIGRYVVRFPRYRILFGPVSINNEYASISRQLIASFLRLNNFHPERARHVKARIPLRHRPIRGWDPRTSSKVVKDIGEVTSLIEEIETVHRGLPVLLRHYLKLGGKLLGFNLDPSFGDVLDGLIVVDLVKSKRSLIERYLGQEGVNTFLRYHNALEEENEEALDFEVAELENKK